MQDVSGFSVANKSYTSRKVQLISICILLGIGNAAAKAIYGKTNQWMEKFSDGFITLLMYGTVPSFMLPIFITSYYNYFSTKSKTDSFEMPYPMW